MAHLSRDQLIYMAKISEQTERFEDMLNCMKQVVSQNPDLSIEERNLLSVAYKNSVGSRRTVTMRTIPYADRYMIGMESLVLHRVEEVRSERRRPVHLSETLEGL